MTGVHSVRGDEPIFEVEKSANVLVLQLVRDPSIANYRSKQFEYNRMMKELAAVDVEHHASAADGLEHFHLARDLAGDDSLHACIDRQRDVLAGGHRHAGRYAHADPCCRASGR